MLNITALFQRGTINFSFKLFDFFVNSQKVVLSGSKCRGFFCDRVSRDKTKQFTEYGMYKTRKIYK